jgi:hypothetical protein
MRQQMSESASKMKNPKVKLILEKCLNKEEKQ